LALVKPHPLHYFQTMVKDCLFVPALAGCALFLHPAMADTIQLKDKASVVGKVLAEKRDQVAVDIGYTVLVIPRNQILKIAKTDEAAANPTKLPVAQKTAPDPDSKTENAVFSELKPGFYSGANKLLPARTVRDLVNQLGEAVVQ